MKMRWSTVLFVSVTVCACWVVPVGAQQPVISEEQQVTSVELYAGMDWGWVKKWLTGREKPGPRLDPDELELFVDGTRVAVSSTEVSEAPEPWQIVLYFDAVLQQETGLRAAARALAAVAPRLVELGDVEVVVADPAPRLLLAASRSAEDVQAALADLSLFGTAEDRLPLLRQEFVDFVEQDAGDESEIAALAAALAAEESRLGLERRDTFADYLMAAALPGRGRAVFWALEGFDPVPERFYGAIPDARSTGGSTVSGWARTIAGHGWTAFPFSVESRGPVVRRGFRVGKFRFNWAGLGFTAAWEGDRKPEQARALLDLGDTRDEQGDTAGAMEAFEGALYHYYGDPDTALEQAQVWLRMADLHRGDGRSGRARKAVSYAVALDPTLSPELGTPGAYFSDVQAGLAELAIETGGAVLRTDSDLEAAAADLGGRIRLTFELAGSPRGELLALSLASEAKSRELRFMRWTRSGIPPEAAAIRLRSTLRELADEPAGGGSVARLERIDDSPAERVRVEGTGEREARVWIGRASDGGELEIVALTSSPDGGWVGDLPASDAGALAAVYRDDGQQWSVEPVTLLPADDVR